MIIDNKIIGAIAVYRDITKEKAIDQAKTEFVSLASHELRTPLTSVRTAAEMLWLVGSNPILRQKAAPTVAEADRQIDQYVTNYMRTGDANDILYALEASRDYDPGPALEKIAAPLLAVNSADDLVNPPELQILEKEITRVPNGRAMVMPLSDRTVGHGTHTQAAIWKGYLQELLKASESSR